MWRHIFFRCLTVSFACVCVCVCVCVWYVSLFLALSLALLYFWYVWNCKIFWKRIWYRIYFVFPYNVCMHPFFNPRRFQGVVMKLICTFVMYHKKWDFLFGVCYFSTIFYQTLISPTVNNSPIMKFQENLSIWSPAVNADRQAWQGWLCFSKLLCERATNGKYEIQNGEIFLT